MSDPDGVDSEMRHATTVAVKGRGLMIEGASGAGKSALALQMLALGARLVADDVTEIRRGKGTVALWAGAPQALPAKVEARGIGLVAQRLFGTVPLRAVLSLDLEETDRLPHSGHCTILGQNVTLFRRPRGGPLASAMMLTMATVTT